MVTSTRVSSVHDQDWYFGLCLPDYGTRSENEHRRIQVYGRLTHEDLWDQDFDSSWFDPSGKVFWPLFLERPPRNKYTG